MCSGWEEKGGRSKGKGACRRECMCEGGGRKGGEWDAGRECVDERVRGEEKGGRKRKGGKGT